MDPQQPSAPPVVAVVVTADPGEWFEETLTALAAQDYPNQSVLVVDAASRVDPAPRVAAVLPDAYLRRLEKRASFATMANDVLATVEGSAYLLFCHDDVAPEPDAVRRMVEEALRSNAGVVGPKLVEWDRPQHLLEVGLAVDKTGAGRPLVDRGELDQEQHDSVRDVFAVSSACMLLRSDLFATLGGFDQTMDDQGADIDLCWRAQVAGARVLVAPAARARHREDGIERSQSTDLGDGAAGLNGHHAAARDNVRAMLKSYSFPHLVRVLPQAVVVTVVEAFVALFGGRRSAARHFLGAWWWNLRHYGELRPLRRKTQQARAIPDSEVRRLQVGGSVRLSAYLRRRLHTEERARALLSAGQHLAEDVEKAGPTRSAFALLLALSAVLLIGSRHLVGDSLPAVGQLAPLPNPATLLRHFLDGWRTTGMGAETPAPPVFGLLGLGGAALLGKVDVLQKVLVLGAWPVAAAGAWRLATPLRSTMSKLVAVAAILACPLSYNALARGRWTGLIAFAAAPWLLAALARRCGLQPFAGDPSRQGSPGDDSEGDVEARASADGAAFGGSGWTASTVPGYPGYGTEHDRGTPWLVQSVRLGLPLAVVMAFAPSAGVALLVAAAGLVLGSALAGELGSVPRAVGVAASALGVAILLLLPWSLGLLAGGDLATIFGVPVDAGEGFGVGALLRFQVGPMGAGVLGWALIGVAALPLVVARGWRLRWAVRFWGVFLACVLVAWASGRQWLPLPFQTPDVLLAFAAAGLAGAVAMSAVTFERDLRGFRFGWRQVLPVLAAVGMVGAVIPVALGARDGRWELPSDEITRTLAWMGAEEANGAFRVLWVGDPRVLPLDGWRHEDGVAYATSRNGPPEAVDLLPGPSSDTTEQISDAIRLAQRGDTTRLGRILAPMAIRYIVLPHRLSAGSDKLGRWPPPPDVLQAFDAQLDLRQVTTDVALDVYENTAWGPGRGLLPAGPESPPVPTSLGAGADLSGARAVLAGDGPVRFQGTLPGGGQVLLAEAPSSRWALKVAGEGTPRRTGFGVANVFDTPGGGRATLAFRTPFIRYLFLLVEVGLWVGAVIVIWQHRRRFTGETL